MPVSAPSPDTAARLVDALRGRGWLAATAESCTGGGVAQAITSVAGSSEVFDRAFVTYSNEAKTEMLGVDAGLVRDHGAVSEPVALAMAAGAIAASRADVAVAITGIAGPGGGSAAKPVGTVCFAYAARGTPPVACTRRLPGDRAAVRAGSVTLALEGLLRMARGEPPAGP
ncbi:MAG: CinA family protein [Burkholderiales bacterium]|nr:CinA family protein [Burkholderiales bacterium]